MEKLLVILTLAIILASCDQNQDKKNQKRYLLLNKHLKIVQIIILSIIEKLSKKDGREQ